MTINEINQYVVTESGQEQEQICTRFEYVEKYHSITFKVASPISAVRNLLTCSQENCEELSSCLSM
jgi:hypothetical protein